MEKDILTYIQKLLINSNNKFNSKAIQKKWWQKRNIEHLYQEIHQTTSFLNEKATVQERFYCLINNIKEIPKCVVCSKKTKYVNSRNGKCYQTTCSLGCASSKENIQRQIKRANTNFKKYGVSVASKNKNVIAKTKKTCFERYGYYGHFQSNEYKQKRQKDLLSNNFTEDFLYKEHILNQKTHVLIAHENGVSPALIDQLCRKFNIETCNYCKRSLGELELVNFIKSIYDKEIVENRRDIINKEIDIFLPDSKLALEYHGIYWHSYNRKETQKEKSYHYNKKLQCNEQNIQLIQIFENEWKNKQHICKSIICSKLRIFQSSFYARKCKVVEISNKRAKEFLEQNHIQGNVFSKINLGLFCNDELLSIMTFSKPRYDKKHEWELTRYCCKLNTQIIGGANKMFSFFKKTYLPKSIISYADMRFSNGELYNRLGFSFLRESTPNYFYYKVGDLTLYSRNHFQKHKLSKLLPKFDSSLTEAQNMFNNGYRRIWDAGNLVYSYIA